MAAKDVRSNPETMRVSLRVDSVIGNSVPLTDTRIRSLKPSERPYKLTDSGGLVLEVRPTGACLWRYRYRLAGKENMFAIGTYPDVSLKEAREARDDARKLVQKGTNPAQQRKIDKLRRIHEGANTFEAVAREWLATNKKHWAPRTHRQRERLLERDVFPHIGSLPIGDVTRVHGNAIIKRIERRAPQMAVIAKWCLGAISDLAVDTERAEVQLVVRHKVRTRPVQHKRPLQPNEIPKFFRALDKFPGYFPTKGAIRLLWLTLVRPKEVLEARWDEFDLEEGLWVIPAERMKMGQPHRVPLPTQAVEVLESIKAVTGRFDHLVPNRSDPQRHASHSLLIKALHSMGYGGKFSPHGIRVTGRTILGEQGHPRDVLERQLAHADTKHVRAYDQGDRLEARRVIMQQWADYLDGLCAGRHVVNFSKRAKA